jgi:hypothetical protein
MNNDFIATRTDISLAIASHLTLSFKLALTVTPEVIGDSEQLETRHKIKHKQEPTNTINRCKLLDLMSNNLFLSMERMVEKRREVG